MSPRLFLNRVFESVLESIVEGYATRASNSNFLLNVMIILVLVFMFGFQIGLHSHTVGNKLELDLGNWHVAVDTAERSEARHNEARHSEARHSRGGRTAEGGNGGGNEGGNNVNVNAGVNGNAGVNSRNRENYNVRRYEAEQGPVNP